MISILILYTLCATLLQIHVTTDFTSKYALNIPHSLLQKHPNVLSNIVDLFTTSKFFHKYTSEDFQAKDET